MADVVSEDVSNEKWREYDFLHRVYRIESPKTVHYIKGGGAHKVVDSEGVVHCVPAPGSGGCVVKFLPVDPNAPVTF